MGIFQPAVLPTAVWHDFLPSRLFQVISGSDVLTTATAGYPGTANDKQAVFNTQQA